MSMSDIEERELIEAAQKGDIAAFGNLIRLHHIAIRSYLIVRTNNAHDAEDLAQDTIVIAFKKIGEFDSEKAFRPWLRGIAFKLLANYRKKHRPTYVGGNRELDELVNHTIEEIRKTGGEAEMIEALQSCFKTLGVEARSLISDYYEQGRSVLEISVDLGRKRSAVAMQLHRIRLSLKMCIQGRSRL
ncbi:MAG: sigma-70 family RNA polymerase sigma factor [Opitutaceae bacterium]|nr:sigma-70 family RNA polymerase sigma factor [Opitutaceae bacterium]